MRQLAQHVAAFLHGITHEGADACAFLRIVGKKGNADGVERAAAAGAAYAGTHAVGYGGASGYGCRLLAQPQLQVFLRGYFAGNQLSSIRFEDGAQQPFQGAVVDEDISQVRDRVTWCRRRRTVLRDVVGAHQAHQPGSSSVAVGRFRRVAKGSVLLDALDVPNVPVLVGAFGTPKSKMLVWPGATLALRLPWAPPFMGAASFARSVSGSNSPMLP